MEQSQHLLLQIKKIDDFVLTFDNVPAITLIGDDPLTWELGTSYVDPGATATDAEDGDITGDIVIDSSAVDINTIDSYIVSYSVTDSVNQTSTVYRTVNVLQLISQIPLSAMYNLIRGTGTRTLNNFDIEFTVGLDHFLFFDSTVMNFTPSDPWTIIMKYSYASNATGGHFRTKHNVNNDGSTNDPAGQYLYVYGPLVAQDSPADNWYAPGTPMIVDYSMPNASLVTYHAENLDLYVVYKYDGSTYTNQHYAADGTTQLTSARILNATFTTNTVIHLYMNSLFTIKGVVLGKDATTLTPANFDTYNNFAPIITLNGSSTITHPVNTTYVEQGATVTDDSGETINAVITGTVDVNTEGSYIISYNATDSGGKQATEVQRTVVVDEILVTLTSLTQILSNNIGGSNPVILNPDGTVYQDVRYEAAIKNTEFAILDFNADWNIIYKIQFDVVPTNDFMGFKIDMDSSGTNDFGYRMFYHTNWSSFDGQTHLTNNSAISSSFYDTSNPTYIKIARDSGGIVTLTFYDTSKTQIYQTQTTYAITFNRDVVFAFFTNYVKLTWLVAIGGQGITLTPNDIP